MPSIMQLFRKATRTSAKKEAETTAEIIGTRKHIVMAGRESQITVNILGWHGGRPYIDTRLSRFAGETEIDWIGGMRGRTNISGRKEQAHNLPYLNRAVDKINQYTFGILPTRENADEAVLKDITRTGESIDQVMWDVNSYLTVARWCWMKIDAPNTDGEEITEAKKKDDKIRPFWTVLSPLSIVDWKIDSEGKVLWVAEEWSDYVAEDPRVRAELKLMRTLWEPGKATDYELKKNDKDEEEWKLVEEKVLSLKEQVPIFPVGDISAKPHFFDDTEGVNRSIMNLGSVNYANFFRCVYPQLCLPASVLQTVMENFKVNAEKATDMILGLKYPIFMQQEDKDASYLMPDAASIGTIRKEITELVHEMFGTIGLIHQNQTNSAQTGISKEYDFQDIVAVVRERATILEDAEKQAIKISMKWDPEFKEWVPKYNRTVSVGSAKDTIDSIVAGNNLDMPIELKRLALRKWYEHIKTLGSGQVDPEVQELILQAITEWEEKSIQVPTEIVVEEEEEGEDE